MQWLKLIPEDSGTRDLMRLNRRPAVAPEVRETPAAPRVETAKAERRQGQARPPQQERRQGERRQGERRKKQVPVLLDTRSKQDRRAIGNRRAGDQPADDEQPPPYRLDERV